MNTTTPLNVLEDSIENATNRVFDEQWRLAETSPPDLLIWAEDIDLKGTKLHEFVRQCMDSALTDGMVHVLVDYPLSPTRSVEEGTLDPYGTVALGLGAPTTTRMRSSPRPLCAR